MALSPGFHIRATRADPPAKASEGPRRATYGAALAQFDELLAAAASNSPAARPLPLFYALSQAGRAIACAHATEPWRLRMHGLGAPHLDAGVLDIAVVRATTVRADSVDSFTGVASATHSPLFEDKADVRSLWASLPEISDLLTSPRATTSLLLVPEGVNARIMDWEHVSGFIVGYAGEPEELPAYLEAAFPTAAGARLSQLQGVPTPFEAATDFGPGWSVWWEPDAPNVAGHRDTLRRVAPSGSDFEPRWLRPGVSGAAVSPLMTWWALLFALSMVARYEPAGWMSALDYDDSNLAAPLEQLLDAGLDRIPELVLAALRHPGNAPDRD